MSVITDTSTPLILNSLSNLDIINKINSNTQLFINSNMLSNALLPYTTSNYIISTSNILQTNINTKQNILTASTSLLGNGAAITNLAYTNITGKPTNFQADWTSTVINKPSSFPADMTTIYTKTETNNLLNAKEAILTFSTPLTRTTNTIGINLGSYSTTGTDTSYLLKTGGTLTGTLTLPTNSWSIKTADNIDRMYFNNGGTTYFHSGNTNGDGFKFRSTAQIDIMTLTDAGALTATSFTGNGAALTNLAYANITGKPTNFQADWTSTVINKPSTFPADMTTIYTKTETDNLLNAKQATLTAATNLLGIGSSISALDYTKITIGKPTNFQADWTSTIINKPSTFPADMTTIYTKTETNNLLNAKEAILTFSSPLTRTTNTIGINLGSYSTTGTDASYLLKTGGTLTGDFNIEKASPIFSIKSQLENQTSFFYLSTPVNITAGLKTAIISQGLSAWGRSKLHFCLNDNQTDNSTAQNATVSHARMTIQPNGYVGIGTTNTNYMLDVYTDNTSINNTIRIRANTAREATLILDRSGTIWSIFNKGSGFGGATNNLSFSSSSTSQIMEMTQSGNVGINNTSPSEKLDVTGNTKISGSLGINSTSFLSRFTIRMNYGDGNTGGLCIDSADVTNTYNLRLYSYVQAGAQVGYIFQVNNIASSVNAIILNYNGSVNIGNLQIAGYDSHYYLFNNTGGTHGDVGDFNNVSTFGYKFIQGTTNGPNTHSAGIPQYYSWSMGLGANYPYSQYVCQFGIPRNVSNPTLSVRYKENSSWGGWSGITAGKLNGTAILATDNWVYTNEASPKQRFYFGANARNYYQGYPSANISHEFRGSAGTAIFTLTDGGSAVFSGSITASANSSISGDLSLFTGIGGGTGAFYCAGNLTCTMGSVDSYGNDYLGVANTSAGGNTQYSRTLYIMFNTFTGIHRCFTNDPLYDNDDPQKFKDNYMGRIVVSTGKIATDMKSTENNEWEIKYDKEGITIEDALPQIELSRKRRDKRVFGVLGLANRNNSRPERLIVNSVGEGGIWVINSNGNIENGDYIQSSYEIGYGEKQEDDILHNYTVAKATMDCNFELDSPLYESRELGRGGYTIAFISCTYHCG